MLGNLNFERSDKKYLGVLTQHIPSSNNFNISKQLQNRGLPKAKVSACILHTVHSHWQLVQANFKYFKYKRVTVFFFPQFFLHILACYYNITMITIYLCWMVFPVWGSNRGPLGRCMVFFITLAASRIRTVFRLPSPHLGSSCKFMAAGSPAG